jgi:hypothetical protein
MVILSISLLVFRKSEALSANIQEFFFEINFFCLFTAYELAKEFQLSAFAPLEFREFFSQSSVF